MLLASINSTCFRNMTFWFWNIISKTFYCSKWKSHDSIFHFHTVMYIDGIATQKLNASAIFQIHCNSPYKTETDFTKKTKIVQSFKIRPLDFDFLASFLKYWINWLVVLLKLNVFRKCYRNFGKICRDLFQVMKCVNGQCFLCYSGRCVTCLWSVSFWEIYENKNCAFPLGLLLATFIMLLSIIHLNNGFRFDEASYSEVFRMRLERLFSY